MSSSSPLLRFDGRVAIITGAGGALGRAYARLLSSRGCAVVVNDLGVPMQGAGTSRGPAEAVVAEIVAAGGKAIANYDSVQDGAKIVAATIAAFGRVDIVINNAGVLRDASFGKMTDEQWRIIQSVHVDGAYHVTKAAWPYMMKQKYGRVIMTSSASGLYGNAGQANYSAAKLALVGFGTSLAKEGIRYNIHTNIIAPIAGSRMTETVMPADLVAALDPKHVAPVVAYLCHENTKTNGLTYETGAGYVAQVRMQRSAGVAFPLGTNLDPEMIASRIGDISDFTSNAENPRGLNDTMAKVMSQLSSAGIQVTKTNVGTGAKPINAAKPVASQLSAAKLSATASAFKSDEIFGLLRTAVRADPTIATKLNAVFQYNIASSPATTPATVKVWTVSLKKGKESDVLEGAPAKADVTVDVSDADYCDLVSGKKSAQMLYMKGVLKMKGNLMLAMKFDSVLREATAPLKKAAEAAALKAKL